MDKNEQDSSRASEVAVYRVRFECAHIGKCVASTKRKISWRLGVADLSALREGRTDHSFRGDEHEVQLIWSVRSGKTRVLWDDKDISHVFPELDDGSDDTGKKTRKHNANPPPSILVFKWQTRSGETFKIVANCEPAPGIPQYDLFVDGRSFFSLPTLSELGVKEHTAKSVPGVARRPVYNMNQVKIPNGAGLECFENKIHADPEKKASEESTKFHVPHPLGSATPCNHELLLVNSPKTVKTKLEFNNGKRGSGRTGIEKEHSVDDLTRQQHQRLASAGFVTFAEFGDELHSDLYSNSLETLRDDLSASVPETEQMISRAIINAFSGDVERDSIGRKGSSNKTTDAIEIEADALWEAFECKKYCKDFTAADAHDQILIFMQKHVDAMVACVKDEAISAVAASQIIHSVAAVLDFELTVPLPRNTVVLFGLRKITTDEDIREAMKIFGTVEAAAVAKGGSGFGICRFLSTSAAPRACDAASRKEVIIQGFYPRILELPITSQTDAAADKNWKETNGASKLDSEERQENTVDSNWRPFGDDSSSSIHMIPPPPIREEASSTEYASASASSASAGSSTPASSQNLDSFIGFKQMKNVDTHKFSQMFEVCSHMQSTAEMTLESTFASSLNETDSHTAMWTVQLIE